MTEIASIKNTPQRRGIINSFLINIEMTAINPPTVRLPVSPIKIEAGYVLYQRNPTKDPRREAINIVISPTLGIYIIFK